MTARLQELPWQAIADCASPLSAAFDALDTRLADAVRMVRARPHCTLDELRGVVVGHDRVDALLAGGRRVRAEGSLVSHHGRSISVGLLLLPAWRALADWCAPEPVERDLVLLALAWELFDHYEPVFGYLNDDLTRRWPTRALVRQLLAQDEQQASLLNDATAVAAPLVQAGVLRLLDNSPRARPLPLVSG